MLKQLVLKVTVHDSLLLTLLSPRTPFALQAEKKILEICLDSLRSLTLKWMRKRGRGRGRVEEIERERGREGEGREGERERERGSV